MNATGEAQPQEPGVLPSKIWRMQTLTDDLAKGRKGDRGPILKSTPSPSRSCVPRLVAGIGLLTHHKEQWEAHWIPCGKGPPRTLCAPSSEGCTQVPLLSHRSSQGTCLSPSTSKEMQWKVKLANMLGLSCAFEGEWQPGLLLPLADPAGLQISPWK
jgi:hypothetical protein